MLPSPLLSKNSIAHQFLISMKNYLPTAILLCLIGLSISGFAQPSYTSNSNPAIGESWDVVMLDPANFSPGPAGAMQSWDFSTVPVSTGFPPFQFNVVKPEDGPLSDSFPNATHILYWDVVGFQFYQYEFADNQNRTVLGGVVPEDTSILSLSQYVDDDDAMQYPLTYQKSYAFTAKEELTSFGFTFEYYTEGQVDVDAYGSLTLPTGTYNDVLRMRIERTSVDSLFGIVERDTTIQYGWFQEGNAMPLVTYEYTLGADADPPSLYYATPANANAIDDDFSNGIHLYPNPIKQHAYLHLPDNFGQTELEVNLFDLQGKAIRKMYKGKLNNAVLSLDFQGINRGVYLLKINDQKGNITFKKVVKL